MRRRLRLSDEEFVFGFAGRLSEEKGVHHLIAAAHEVLAERPSARFLIVGDGPRRPELEAAARARGLDRRFDFSGFQGDTSPWYAAMDAFVLPSLTEGTPMALLEAMAHGLPAIASAVGGVPAVIGDRVNGLLVPAGDAGALQAAMLALMNDAALRHSLGENAVRSVEAKYGVPEWVGRIKRLYAQSLADRPYAWRYSRS
jgi:glycosyltransferase involved in cell wall biosynthesis